MEPIEHQSPLIVILTPSGVKMAGMIRACRIREMLPAVFTSTWNFPPLSFPGINSIWVEPSSSPVIWALEIFPMVETEFRCCIIIPGFGLPARMFLTRNFLPVKAERAVETLKRAPPPSLYEPSISIIVLNREFKEEEYPIF